MKTGRQNTQWLGEGWQVALMITCALILVTVSVTSPIDRDSQFDIYVAFNTLLCLVLPLAFAKACGWNWSDVGFQVGNGRCALVWIAIATIFMLPLLIACAHMEQFQAYYPFYTPAKESLPAFIKFALGMTIYFFGWEFLFRGFMLFVMKRRFGALAILIQAIPFWLAHVGKPQIEFISALPGGVMAGVIAWQCNSFIPVFAIHAIMNVLLNAFVIAFGR